MSNRFFWVGVLGGVIASILVGLFALPALGVFEMTATGKPGFLDWWGAMNWQSSLQWRAPDAQVPADADASEGIEHYRSMCLPCHGAPAASRAEWAHHMQPMPPKLWESDTQSMSDGELFHIIRGGVRMSGMPAFGPDHDNHHIWDIVAFVRQLNNLTPQQSETLQQAASQQGHHAGSHHGEPHSDASPHDSRHEQSSTGSHEH